MWYHQRQLMSQWKNHRIVRKSQQVQTFREKLAVESLILSMPMATKFDQRKKIKKLAISKRNQIKQFSLEFFNNKFYKLMNFHYKLSINALFK
jgi:hypothetical protein